MTHYKLLEFLLKEVIKKRYVSEKVQKIAFFDENNGKCEEKMGSNGAT